ncbi:MAG: hypothetical protein ABI036_05390 [Fibrobacteria bacterium]
MLDKDLFQDIRIRKVITTCLSGQLFLLIMMFLADYIRLGISGDFSSLGTDPGIPGLWLLTVLVCLNLFAQVSVQITDNRLVKRIVAGFVGFYGLFFLGHQLIHYRADGFNPDVHVLLDASHHILAGIALWYAIKWAKLNS